MIQVTIGTTTDSGGTVKGMQIYESDNLTLKFLKTLRGSRIKLKIQQTFRMSSRLLRGNLKAFKLALSFNYSI